MEGAPLLLTDLPADVVQHIVVRLTLAHHIARAAPTCTVVSVAARNLIKARGFSSEVVTLAGHTSTVYGVAAAPDGRIVTGSADRTIKVWREGTCERTIQAQTSWVSAVAAMPDGQRILSGGMDDTVRVWLLDGTLENTFSELHDAWVRALVALPDNQHALSASNDHTVKLFNVNDGTVLRTFKHHVQPDQSRAAVCLALLPDGLRFVSGSCDGTAVIAEHGLAPQ